MINILKNMSSQTIFNTETNRTLLKSRNLTKKGLLIKRLRDQGYVYNAEKGEISRVKPILINNNTGDIIHIDPVQNKPLIIQEIKEKAEVSNFEANQIIQGQTTISGWELIDEVQPNQQVRVVVKFFIDVVYDGETFTRDFLKTYIKTPAELDTINYRQEILLSQPWLNGMENWDFKIKIVSTIDNDDEFQKVNMKLRKAEELEIFNRNLLKYKGTSKHQNCVKNFLLNHWNGKAKKDILAMGDDEGVSPLEVYDLCVKKKVKIIIYDINGKVLKANYVKASKKFKSISFISYDNHIYPLKSPTLSKCSTYEAKQVRFIDDAKEKMIEFLKKGIKPYNITGSFSNHIRTEDPINITSFMVYEVKYISNPDYKICEEILSDFGLKDKMRDNIGVNNLASIIAPLYFEKDMRKEEEEKKDFDWNKSNVQLKYPHTFWPDSHRFIKGGFFFSQSNCKTIEGKIPEDKDIITIDKNKCYSMELKNLPYLIHFDYRQNDIKDMFIRMTPSTKLKPHYLYIVKPDYSTILIPNENVYSGEFLTYCYKQGVKFIIKERITTEQMPNNFRKMIDDIYKRVKDINVAKHIINCYIGKMETSLGMSSTYSVDNIYNKKEASITEGSSIELNESYSLKLKSSDIFNLYNMKPVSIQVKDNARKTLYEAMVKLGLKNKDIIQVKTDSISFLKDSIEAPDQWEFICKRLCVSSDIFGWKKEKYKPINSQDVYASDKMTFHNNTEGKNTLYDCYAGTGKSYQVVNNIIPNMEGSYMILTPSHSTIEEYRKLNFNCEVIQKFSFSNTTPKEDTIIIDEIGLADRKSQDVIYKCYLQGKNIIALGDGKQLLPVGVSEPFWSDHFMKQFYRNKVELKTNYRNNFTIEYYDKLINNSVNLNHEVLKYSSDNWYDAERIICYRNETANTYNKMWLNKNNKESMWFVGASLRCTTNDIGPDTGIYNNFYVKIAGFSKHDIIFEDGTRVNKEKAVKHKWFTLGYASTLYGAQGRGFKSYYYPKEDLYFINGRSAYTLISRLVRSK